MSVSVSPDQAFNGHNRISTQALTSLAKVAAAQALGVDAQEVRADWTDDDGLLALSILAPISVPPLRAASAARASELSSDSIWERTVQAKALILESVSELSGASLSRVDIRISGAKISEGERVR